MTACNTTASFRVLPGKCIVSVDVLEDLVSLRNPVWNDESRLKPDISCQLFAVMTEDRPQWFEITALPENLQRLRAVVKDILSKCGVDASVADASVLSVGEAAMNIVQHGFGGGAADGKIRLEVDFNDNELVFRLLDNAPSVNGDEFQSRNLDDIRPGGLGSYFMRELMDSIIFLPTPTGQGNVLEMRKRIESV